MAVGAFYLSGWLSLISRIVNCLGWFGDFLLPEDRKLYLGFGIREEVSIEKARNGVWIVVENGIPVVQRLFVLYAHSLYSFIPSTREAGKQKV